MNERVGAYHEWTNISINEPIGKAFRLKSKFGMEGRDTVQKLQNQALRKCTGAA